MSTPVLVAAFRLSTCWTAASSAPIRAAVKASGWWRSPAIFVSSSDSGHLIWRRWRNSFAVVQARGVVIMTLTRVGLPIVEFPPMQIKQALTGNGHADKDEVLDAVMRELDLDTPPRPDDAADALAVALTGWFQR